MLIELRLENYAVVDNLAVEFAPGLNLLTGETGAGKSILIDALALLLGDKASSDVIRSGADKATISAVFEVEGGAEKTVAQILENNGIDQEDESIILRREIAAGGKGRVFVNNQPATVAVLRQLAPYSRHHSRPERIAAVLRRVYPPPPARHLRQYPDRSRLRSILQMEEHPGPHRRAAAR